MKGSTMGRGEYLIILGLVVITVIAAPAFRDVQAAQSFVLALCTSLGLN